MYVQSSPELALYVFQDDNTFLEDFMKDNGYFLTCSSYPKGDITVKTHQEENVYD